MYINSDLSYNVRDDLNYHDDDYEMMWVEVDKRELKTLKNYVIGLIYIVERVQVSQNLTIFSQKSCTLFHWKTNQHYIWEITTWTY